MYHLPYARPRALMECGLRRPSPNAVSPLWPRIKNGPLVRTEDGLALGGGVGRGS